ncbi:MAG: zinc transporter substrate-binding protein, partial [Mycobacterium sp.]|nr:zinc transporter substrate-binding protein [Mycobacterium sp.]
MTRRALVAVLAAVAMLLPACGGQDSEPGAAQVVVTTNILGDVVEKLVGDSAEVTVLMKPNADPHSFELSAQEADTMSRADLIVYNGLGLEEGVAHH